MIYDKNFDSISISKEDGLKLTKEELCELLFKNGWDICVHKSGFTRNFSEERWNELKSMCEERKRG